MKSVPLKTDRAIKFSSVIEGEFKASDGHSPNLIAPAENRDSSHSVPLVEKQVPTDNKLNDLYAVAFG